MRPVLSRISNNGYQVTIQLCCIFIIVKVHLAIILINELFQNNYGLIETNKWIPLMFTLIMIGSNICCFLLPSCWSWAK